MITPRWQDIIDKYYSDNAPLRAILIAHSGAVARLAKEINNIRGLNLDPEMIEYAAMLHDVGIVRTNAPAIECRGSKPYICHGAEGADMLRQAGAPEFVARVAERHTGSGISEEDIESQKLQLPRDRTYMPQDTLEKLICYADKFFSKRPGCLTSVKSFEKVRGEMLKFGADSLNRFDELDRQFHIAALV